MSSFPLSKNGKIDRKLFPIPNRFSDSNDYMFILPSNEIEEFVVTCCSSIFKKQKISMSDDFFLSLGGNSLHVLSLISLLKKNSLFATLSITVLFNYLSLIHI